MLYIMQGDKSIYLSGYSADSPEWEANHIELTDAFTCRSEEENRLSTEGLRNTVVNVLRDAGVQFVEE
jgi:hypothetical protein